jgi:PAS domain S-box-containing protein
MKNFIRKNKLNLSFKKTEDEKKYNNFLKENLNFQIRFILITSAIFFGLSPIKDYLISSKFDIYYWLIRVLVILLFAYQIFYTYKKNRKFKIQNGLLIITSISGLLAVSTTIIKLNIESSNTNFGILGFLLMWTTVLMGIKFRPSLIIVVTFLFYYQILGIYSFVNFNSTVIFESNILIIPTAILSLFVAYFLHKERRLNYLQNIQIKGQNKEIKEYTNELSTNENSLKEIMNEIPILVFSITNEYEIQYWNKSCEESTLFSKEDATTDKKFIEKLFPEESYRKKIIKHFGSGKKSFNNFETRITTKDGQKIIVSWQRIKQYEYLSNSPNWYAGIDITDNFETWKALQKSEQRLKDAQGTAHIGSWEWNVQTNKFSWSEEMYKMFGIENQNDKLNIIEILKNSVSSSEFKKYIELANRAVIEKKPILLEYSIFDAEGKEKIMKLEGDVVLDRKGEVSHMYGSNLDITELKQAEIKLSQIKRSLEKAQKIAKIGNWEYNFASKEYFASEELLEIFGFENDQNLLLPDAIEKFIDIKDKEKFEHFFETAIIEGNNCETEFRIRNSKNEKKIISSLAEIEKINKKIISVNIIFHDITLFKKILNEVTKNEEKFRNILQSSPDGIIVMDRDGNIKEYNLASLEIFNYTNEDFKNIRLPELFEEQEFAKFTSKISSMIETNVSFKNENFIMKKNNSEEIPVEISAGIVGTSKESESMSIVALIKDITERSQYERELKHARTRAEDADKLKSSFLANMSHEIRTPMNAIVGFSNLLSEPDVTETERGEYLNYITMNSATLLTLIDDIIDISKIEAGQIKIKKTPVKISDLFDDIYATTIEQKKVYEKENISLLREIDNELKESTVLIDYIRTRQIFINLINNAIKFTDQGHVKFGAKLSEYFHIKVINFYVEDTGIGIKEKDINLIFNQFVKIESDNEVLKSGTGLGLTISKKLVTLMGGKITAKSIFGKGSEFNFTLPYKTSETVISQKIQIEEHSENEWNNITILIAEDEFTNFKFLETVLKKKNPNIIRAVNGLEAVKHIKENQNISIVLMDIRMPEMDGYEATLKIKALRPDIKIIAQTAFAMNTEKEKIISAGFDDYISKPVEKSKLLSIISKYI